MNGVDIIEEIFRSRYIAAGLEGVFACLSESESRIVLLLLFQGALDHHTEVKPQVAWNPKDTTELAGQYDAEKKNNRSCFYSRRRVVLLVRWCPFGFQATCS